MSKSLFIEPVTPAIQHAEGPHWDHTEQILYYVDTFQATIYRWNFNNHCVSSHKLENHNSVGVVIPIRNKKYELLVAADRNVYSMHWPTKNDHNLKTTNDHLVKLENDKPKNQFNDGKVDSKGRVWLGTLTRNDDLSVASNGGALYMLSDNKCAKVDEKISRTSISNGLAWSKDNKHFYFIDSVTRMVVGYEYNEETGELSNKRIIFNLEEHPDIKGIPDGMTIDQNDHLWVALFGGHSVLNINSETGELIRVVELPVTYVTSVCFGGPDLNILYATTSKLHLDEEGLRKEPSAGSVFAIQNLGVKGLPSNESALY